MVYRASETKEGKGLARPRANKARSDLRGCGRYRTGLRRTKWLNYVPGKAWEDASPSAAAETGIRASNNDNHLGIAATARVLVPQERTASPVHCHKRPTCPKQVTGGSGPHPMSSSRTSPRAEGLLEAQPEVPRN